MPKLEELKECFYHIDADGGGTLDKHVNSEELGA